MGQEILYTSAPQGLRPGASGFCTVCSTAGMEPNLAEFLEGFSGYPHPFKPPDPRTKENPVNYSHVLWTIGGQRYSILSRVADAGLDYTGRTNLLAHHVALPRREADRCPGGPAWVLAQDDFSITKWDGQLKTIPGQKPATTEKPLSKCVAWEQAAGDAGYAGILAESVKDKGGRPVVVIYPSHCDTLALLVEALSLLPPEKRWNVTFATLYSRIYSSFDCQWRFVFHESAEARAAKRDPQSLVLDLTKGALPPARGGELVKLAREGVRAQQAAAPQSAARPAAAAPSSAAAATRPRRGDAPPPVPLESGDLRLAPPAVPGGESYSLPPAEPAINPFARNGRRMPTWLPVGLAFFGGISLTLVVFIVMVMNQKPPPVIAVNDPATKPNLQITSPPPQPLQPEQVEAPSENRPRPSEIVVVPVEQPPMPPPEAPPPQPASEAPAAPIPMQVASVTPAPERVAPSNPFANIIERGRLLKLPPRGATSNLTTGQTTANNGALAEVYTATSAQCELALENRELAFDKVTANLITLERSGKGTQSIWTVVRQPHGALGKKIALARFSLDKQKLTFAWEPALGVDPSVLESLRLCTLKLTVGEESIQCQMSEPVIVDALDFKKGHTTIADFPFRNLKIADAGALTLRVQPQGFDYHLEPAQLPVLKPEAKEKFLAFKDGPAAGPVIAVLAEFLWPGEGEPKNGDQRAIRSTAIIGFKEDGIPAEECLQAQKRNLTLDDIDALVREKGSNLKQLDINAIRADNDFKGKQDLGKRELERINMQINQAKRKLGDLKGKEKEELQKRINELEEEKGRIHTTVDGFRKTAEEKRQLHTTAEAIVKRGKQIRDFAEDVIAKGRIEFQLVLTRNGDSVILCQSRGFQGGKDF